MSQSFERAAIIFLKSLANKNDYMLHNILETKLLLPKVKASLASERLVVCNQGLTCKLSNIMLYETLLVSDIYL